MLKNQLAGLKRTDFTPILITVVVIGILRFAIGMFFVELRGPLGLFAIAICLPVLIVAILCLIAIIIVVVKSIRRTRSIVPTFVLLGGLAIIFLIPLPPASPTPEEILFFEHQSDFEQVVELARNNQLVRKSNTGLFFTIPVEYKQLSNDLSIYLYIDSERGLYIEFQPYDFYSPIVYVENDSEKSCWGDLNVEEKLIDHWYVCEREWN